MSTSPARQRLRALEDATFGANATRISGEIEKGHGSPFARLDETTRKQFLAVDRLIAAEHAMAATGKALELATSSHKAAQAKHAAMEKQIDLPAVIGEGA